MVEDKEAKKKLKKTSQKGLRMMQKNRSHNLVRKEMRIAKYGIKGFGRNIWLSSAATAVMSITLIILFVTVVASVILTSTAEMMKNKIDITIYFNPGTTRGALLQLEGRMREDENVKEITTTTSEDEYNILAKEYENDETLKDVINQDVQDELIKNMYATMRIKVKDPMNLDSVKKIVEEDSLFKENVTKDENRQPTYDVNQAEINTITSWARIARTGGVILAVVFLVISVLIIFSTIRMAIFSRREEIYMMKLVGADKSFIRGPFLVEAEICGIIAGLIAATASYFMFKFLAPRLTSYGIDVSQITEILDSNKLIIVFLIFIAMGIIIGRISARLAVARYLSGKQK
ncbi:permease-like cell division protein FtsX [Candidatus Saccharibacteria bacterium]|nr:permease-like cell division protein FtsX [Candidatus Saccharibacteria bacterium]